MDRNKKDILIESISRRIKKVMTASLCEFEKHFPNLDDTKQWGIARFNILTIGNDAIRASKQEIDEFYSNSEVVNVQQLESGIKVKTSMDMVKLLGNTMFRLFGLSIKSNDTEQDKCLSVLFNELQDGVLDRESDGKLYYHINGIPACVKILSILDKFVWPPEIKNQYLIWRKSMVVQYNKEIG